VVPAEPVAEASKKRWYVVKVASGREESIKAAIERMIKIEGLEEFFGQIVIPVERVTEVKKVKETKNGEKITKEKRVVKEKKKFPGYLMAEVEWNGDIQTLFRDTSGVGDFVGSTGPGKEPAPMSDRDVQSMLYGMLPEAQQGGGNKPKAPDKIKLDFEQGDKVRIREGAFATFEGDVKLITLPKEAGETPKVKVVVKVFGRDVEIDLEYWQVDKA
jgi:transcriptional antiterminator NusG